MHIDGTIHKMALKNKLRRRRWFEKRVNLNENKIGETHLSSTHFKLALRK